MIAPAGEFTPGLTMVSRFAGLRWHERCVGERDDVALHGIGFRAPGHGSPAGRDSTGFEGTRGGVRDAASGACA